MRTATLIFAAAMLTACAPAAFTTDDARAAMKARMERSVTKKVEVHAIHGLELSQCDGTAAKGTVTCLVKMDVSFDFDGLTQRNEDTARIRFVRESGQWVAYPAP